jgi:hypothetical protein
MSAAICPDPSNAPSFDDGSGNGEASRDGAFLVSLLVAGGATSINEKVVARLAALQQKHVESPTSYTEAERDDSQVPLEDPRLKLPIYWIGTTFCISAFCLELAFSRYDSVRGLETIAHGLRLRKRGA